MNIDSAIFIGFLVVNFVLGLWSSLKIHNITEYAIGDRKFSTATIAATIVATWVSGDYIFLGITEAYANGLNFIWVVVLGDFLSLFLIGSLFAPRMQEFLGKISIADAMGELYGDKVRIVTAISGLIGVCGIIATQFKLAGLIFEYALEMPGVYGAISAAVIVTLYSSFGGIKSVTFTDIVQFITFGTVIPLIAYILFSSLENMNLVTNIIMNDSRFDYKEVFDFANKKSLYYLFISIFFIIPAFNPAIFQRIAMASSIKQVSNSFTIASITCLFLVLIVSWIGVLMIAIHPNIASNDIIRHIVSDYSFIAGYRGVVLAGIMAMIMSTVDSFINSSAVILTHDVIKTLKIRFIKNELFTARIVALCIGSLSLILSLRDNSLLELIIVTYSLYMPIVTVPFIMTILGFRSSEKSVLIGMSAGLITVILWDYLLQIKEVNSVPLGMAANLIFLVGSHYLLQQPGGWVGIKDYRPVIAIRNERKKRIKKLLYSIKNFNILDICRKNCPRGEGLISILGIFIMISLAVSTHTLPKEPQLCYKYLIDIFYPIILLSSTALISYPLWLEKWKNIDLIAVIWNLIIIPIVVCFSFFMVLISKFAEIQLMAFMVNIIMLSTIISWRWALFTITLGVAATSTYYQQYISPDLGTESLSLQFKIAYLLLLIISILFAFLRPKQEYQELTEEKAEHLLGRIDAKDEEVRQALALKGEFIRNVTHEYHAPMTGVISMAEALQDGYDKFSDAQKRGAIDVIVQSAHRLKSYDENIATLSILSKGDYNLKKEEIDLSELLIDRINSCRKLYEKNTEDRFLLEIEEGIIANLDKNYITQLLDNLIINSINYCKKGRIHITLAATQNSINLIISDEGIGIPKNELYEIFEPFTVSSKTRTPAGGRGVGLSVCKKIAEVHGGSISADSNGELGASFTVVLTRG